MAPTKFDKPGSVRGDSMKNLRLILVCALCLGLIAGCLDTQEAWWKELNNQGVKLRHQGKYAEGARVARQALNYAEKAFGRTNPLVATSLNNLALIYAKQGKYSDAELLYKRALEIVEKKLGPEDPRVADCLFNLANLYFAQHRYSDAESLYKRSLAIYKKKLGPGHFMVAICFIKLVDVYLKTEGRRRSR